MRLSLYKIIKCRMMKYQKDRLRSIARYKVCNSELICGSNEFPLIEKGKFIGGGLMAGVPFQGLSSRPDLNVYTK